MTPLLIHTTVNGREHERLVEPWTTAAEFLRDHLGLFGTKVSCENQVCGVCTVLVDGQPVSSCTYLAVDFDGRVVRTVEGLATGGELSPLQASFAQNFGFQCGFCTPGMLMSATALLEQNPEPDDAEIREFMDGNLCRCTGYEQIMTSIKAAVGVASDQGGGQ